MFTAVAFVKAVPVYRFYPRGFELRTSERELRVRHNCLNITWNRVRNELHLFSRLEALNGEPDLERLQEQA